MVAKVICEYHVMDDFNYCYSYSIIVAGVRHHLWSVSNSENGPAGSDDSMEGLARRLLVRIKPSGWDTTQSDAEGNFTKQADLEITAEEASRIVLVGQ